MNEQFFEEDKIKRAYDSNLVKRLLVYIKPYIGYALLALLLVLLATFLMLIGPYLIKLAIDEGIEKGDYKYVYKIAILYLGIEGIMLITTFFRQYLLQYLGINIMYDLRLKLFQHIQKMPMRFFNRNPVGRIVTRVINDVNALAELLSTGLIAIIANIFLLLGITITMLILNVKLTLITFSVLPVLLFATLFFRIKMRDVFREIRGKLARINAFISECFSGIKTIQVFNAENKRLNKFKNINDDHFTSCRNSVLYNAIFAPFISFLTSLIIALILYYGGGNVLQQSIKLGLLVAFINWARMFVEPIRDITNKYILLQQAMASAERIFALFDQKEEEIPHMPVSLPDKMQGKIEFRNVWFAYNDKYVLKDISFVAQPNEKIALVGSTGGGKSTIINLLCKFYRPQKGKILIDNIDIQQIDNRELRKRLGIVLQDVFLFNENIEKNITLNNPYSFDEVKKAAEYVNAHHFIKRMDEGFNTLVYERGARLSVGQKQLLSFARVLIRKPDILILDEATSSVDVESERYIQEAIRKIIENRTSIIIAHRLSTIRDVDRIIVIHRGRIAEEGTHAELLRKNGIYSRLYKLQFKNFY